MSYRIYIDSDSCTVSGNCARGLPEVFAIDGDTAVVLDEDGAPDDQILAAARSCPWAAITVLDRDTGECLCP
ncbi:MAG: ferredoxin [Actinomycetota bacterium]